MPKMKLTDANVKSAKALPTKKSGTVVATEYADTVVNGLALRVSPQGAKSWTYRYRVNGKQKRLSMGKTDSVSLAEARNRAKSEIGKVASGADPVKDKQLTKIANAESTDLRTIEQVGRFYFDECASGRHRPNAKPKKQSTLELETYYFDKDICPAVGNLEMRDLQKAHIQKFINGLGKSASQRCRVILHSLYTFAQRNEIVETNPVQFVTVTGINARERVVNDDELRTIWQALTPPIEIEGASISLGVAHAIQLSLVTLQRRGEIAGMQLSEIDQDKRIWTIPAPRTKNGRTHVVPLSALAMEIIDEALALDSKKGEFVFPSPKTKGQPINPKAITRAFGRLRRAISLEDIRPHDLRRTGATNLTGETLGFTRFTVSKVLNHTSDTGGAATVTGVYDRNEYLAEKRRALNAWAERLQEIVSDKKPESNVVNLRG